MVERHGQPSLCRPLGVRGAVHVDGAWMEQDLAPYPPAARWEIRHQTRTSKTAGGLAKA